MTGRINHITADQPPRLACPEARFAYQTDSDFFLNPGTARGPSHGRKEACVAIRYVAPLAPGIPRWYLPFPVAGIFPGGNSGGVPRSPWLASFCHTFLWRWDGGSRTRTRTRTRVRALDRTPRARARALALEIAPALGIARALALTRAVAGRTRTRTRTRAHDILDGG